MIQKKSWEFDLLGVLPSKEEVFEILGTYKTVIINSQNYLQFFIKIINETPESFPRNQILFTCYSTDLEKYGFEEDFYSPDYERFHQLELFLSECLILFKPLKKVLSNHEEIYTATEIRLIPKMENFKSSQSFKSIPVFSEDIHNMTQDEFTESIIQGKYLGNINGISTEKNDTPSIVLWKENDIYTAYGLFSSHDYAHRGLSLNSDIGVRSIQLIAWDNSAYSEENDSNTLLFIDINTYFNIEQELENAPQILESFREQFIPESEENQKHQTKDKIEEEINMEEDMQQKEQEFLEQFIHVTQDMGLKYDEKDLVNFHTALKSNALTILAGMSGTGKSKLVQAYGRALGLDNTQLIFIPVRPSWTDDADLIGYVDTKNMLYRPSDTYLIDTLFTAQQERNKLFIICFDEMNLSRVEHYFSQFLSVLEMEPNRRMLRLYSDRIEQQIYNSAQYSPEINIGSNVIFVGTVNIDESTYHFSDKVLDRANVINLQIENYLFLKNRDTVVKDSKEKTKKPYTFDQFHKFRKIDSTILLTEDELTLLWSIHEVMQNENKNFGIGPRVIKQIDSYIKNLPEKAILSRDEAFDIQIVQRIMTKLRGPEGLLNSLVGKIEENNTNGLLSEVFEKYKHVSEFKRTKDTLIQKAKELRINGFTV